MASNGVNRFPLFMIDAAFIEADDCLLCSNLLQKTAEIRHVVGVQTFALGWTGDVKIVFNFRNFLKGFVSVRRTLMSPNHLVHICFFFLNTVCFFSAYIYCCCRFKVRIAMPTV